MSSPETSEKSPADSDVAPRPTCAPIAMAMGVSMTLWGLMALTLNINALWFMTATGIGLSAWALKTWIHEIVLNGEATR